MIEHLVENPVRVNKILSRAAKMIKRRKGKNTDKYKESLGVEYKSVKSFYGIDGSIHLEEFIHGSYFNSPLDYTRESVAKYFKSPPSVINLGICKLNKIIQAIKNEGEVDQVFSNIFHGQNITTLCLRVRSGSSLFLRQGDEFGYEFAAKISSCSLTKDIREDESFIDMIIATPGGLELKPIILEEPDSFDLETNYGENFPEYHEKLVSRIKARNKGIVMFHGPPGTGKTHYIRSLIPELLDMNKRVVLIPKHVLSQIESPQFNSFMIDAFTNQNTVFIIEDAESIITKRDGANGYRSELVSTILNITDGILNDIFNIQIILTFNTEINSIDDALLRKGRLISKYEFGPLSKSQATRLSQSIGVQLREDKQAYTLAEVYGMRDFDEDDVLINQNISKPKTFVGF